MLETTLVVALLGLLVGGGLAAATLTFEALLTIGAVVVAGGMLVSVPAGIYYHMILRRLLLEQGPLPHAWWVEPTRYHKRLSERGHRKIRPWFGLGATGCGIMILGCMIAAIGVMIG